MALPQISLLKSSVMLIVLSFHIGLLYLLYYFQPSNREVSYKATELQQEQITQITFITRPKKISTPQSEAKIISHKIPDKVLQVEFVEKNTQSADTSALTINEQAPLNLSLPEAKLDFSPKPRGLLEKPRNPIEYQTTRFNDSWKPQGSAMDSLKWKSKTVNTVLGLFGGNRKLCTDEDKKNSIAGCVPDGYRPENDTSLPIQ